MILRYIYVDVARTGAMDYRYSCVKCVVAVRNQLGIVRNREEFSIQNII